MDTKSALIQTESIDDGTPPQKYERQEPPATKEELEIDVKVVDVSIEIHQTKVQARVEQGRRKQGENYDIEFESQDGEKGQN